MKRNLMNTLTCLAALGAALAWASGTASAQITTNLFTFDTTAVGTWASWQSEYEGYWDNTQDHTGNAGGSLYWYQDISFANGVQIFNTWGGNPYSIGTPAYIDLSTATNLSFWVKWDTTYSTLGIDAFNNQSYASPPGWGDWGVSVGVQTQTPGGQGTVVGTAYIPEAASNGWALVNVPLTPGGVAHENQSVGISLFKWSNTTSSQSGIFAFWIDDIQAEYPGVLPPEILKNLAPAGAQGLNIYDDGNSGDRQSIETVVTAANGLNYGWITNGAPVTYSVNIAQAPPTNYVGGQVHIMIMPGTNITELAPDWNETNAMVLFIQRQAGGSVQGQLRYKLNNPGNNSYLFGSDTNVFGGGGSAVTNTIVAGYGGLLCSVTNANGYLGTWSIQMTSDTQGQLIYPGGTSSFAFPQLSDAQAFAGPVTVYWGVQPNSAGWFQDTVLSSVSITGSINTVSADLTQPLNPNLMALSASSPGLLFRTPTNAVYWLQWAPANPNFVLQSAANLTGPWPNVVGPAITTTNFVNTFDTSNYLAGASRNYNPPPIWIGFDNGDDSAPTVNWMSGPTDDAGGSAASGSVQLQWTWGAPGGQEAFTVDTFGSAQNLSGGTLSFDVMIDPASSAGTNGDYGYFSVVTRDGTYNWNPTTFGEALLTAAGGTTGTWAHVSIPLGTGADSVVRALTFVVGNDGSMSGAQTIYLDNIQLTTSNGSAPAVYNINGNGSTFITSPMLPSSGAGFFRLAK